MAPQTLDAGIYQLRRKDTPKVLPSLPQDPTARALRLNHIMGEIMQDPGAHPEYDIPALLALQEKSIRALTQSATEDALTQTLNLRGYNTEAPKLMDVTRRLEGHLIYAIADIDHFKEINDTYGHAVGDQALSLFGRAARESLRSGDLVARIGGDEFILMLPTPTAAALGAETLTRIKDKYAELLADARAPNVTLSFGTASYDKDVKHLPDYHCMPVDALLTYLKATADSRLYRAKQQRNSIVEAA